MLNVVQYSDVYKSASPRMGSIGSHGNGGAIQVQDMEPPGNATYRYGDEADTESQWGRRLVYIRILYNIQNLRKQIYLQQN